MHIVHGQAISVDFLKASYAHVRRNELYPGRLDEGGESGLQHLTHVGRLAVIGEDIDPKDEQRRLKPTSG